ncbi:hypothetical protein HDU96_000497 [Phlyctochytrium bullatum]|nr:hypothetical protein HDU96_000497 [Phlyctochytrium bullatum]
MQAWMFKFLAAHPDLIPEVDQVLYPRPSAAPATRSRSHSRKLSWPWLFLSSTTPLNGPSSDSSSSSATGGVSPPDFIQVPPGSRCIWVVEIPSVPFTPTSPAVVSPTNTVASDDAPPPTYIGIIELRPPAPPRTPHEDDVVPASATPAGTDLGSSSPYPSPLMLDDDDLVGAAGASPASRPAAFPDFDVPHVTVVMDRAHCGKGYSKEALKAVLAHLFRAPAGGTLDSGVTVSPSSSPLCPPIGSPRSLASPHGSAAMSRPLFFFGAASLGHPSRTGDDASSISSGSGGGLPARAPGRIGIGTLEAWSRDTGIASLAFHPPAKVASSVALEISAIGGDGFGNDIEVEEPVRDFDEALEQTLEDDDDGRPHPLHVGKRGGGATAEKVLEGLGFRPTRRMACGAAGRFVRRRGYGAVLVRRDWMCWEMEREEFLDLWVG